MGGGTGSAGIHSGSTGAILEAPSVFWDPYWERPRCARIRTGSTGVVLGALGEPSVHRDPYWEHWDPYWEGIQCAGIHTGSSGVVLGEPSVYWDPYWEPWDPFWGHWCHTGSPGIHTGALVPYWKPWDPYWGHWCHTGSTVVPHSSPCCPIDLHAGP